MSKSSDRQIKAPCEEIASWVVLFYRGPNPLWFLSRSRFTHVKTIGYSAHVSRWFLLDWTQDGIQIGTLSDEDFDLHVKSALFMQGDMVNVMAKENFNRFSCEPSSCVSMAKKLLGVSGFIFTPDQLHAALVADPANRSFLRSK